MRPIPTTDGAPPPAKAEAIARGTGRLLVSMGYAVLPEVPLPSGRRADLVAVDRAGAILLVEIKSGLADYRSDHKWPHYHAHADRFAFAVGADFPFEVLPAETGLIVADAFQADMVREPPCRPLAAATRKALLIRFGRLAALRLHGLADPGLRLQEVFGES